MHLSENPPHPRLELSLPAPREKGILTKGFLKVNIAKMFVSTEHVAS
jgi:hypothetical protein